MQVTLYKFSKRTNSTKRPSGGTTKTVYWKEKTDMHRPTVKCQSSEVMTYNYMRIGDHYYWIVSEVLMPNGWIEWTGEVDPMATCADEIKATSAFVERSGSGSTSLVDPLAPSMTNGSKELLQAVRLDGFNATGCYVVTVSNFSAPIVLSTAQMSNLYNRLNSQDVIEQLKDSIVRIETLVTGAIWMPFSEGYLPTVGTAQIKAGFVNLGVSGSIVGGRTINYTAGVGGQGSTSSIDSAYYCSYVLHLPFVGAVQISADDMAAGALNVDVAIDPTTGAMEYRVRAGSGIIGTFGGSCGVPVPVGTTSYNVGGTVASAAGMMASLLSGNVFGAIASAGVIASQGLLSSTSIGGGSGSRAGLTWPAIELYLTRRTPPEALATKISVIGLPTYKTMTLGSLSGFVKCIGASVEAAQEGDVIDACNNYLNNGAYIE